MVWLLLLLSESGIVILHIETQTCLEDATILPEDEDLEENSMLILRVFISERCCSRLTDGRWPSVEKSLGILSVRLVKGEEELWAHIASHLQRGKSLSEAGGFP